MKPPSLPRVLLVEDDMVSRAFMAVAVQGVPAEVDSADNFAAALSLANAGDYALWLFDAHLPDGTGANLLRALRILHPHTPALAHTAAAERAVLDGLIDAGFLEVLIKPLSAADVQAAVRRVLGLQGAGLPTPLADDNGKLPVWDDAAAALALNGNRAHIETLRGLFVSELPRLRDHIAVAVDGGDYEQVREALHKLRASCGFVGAARLGAAVRALHQHVDSAVLQARFDNAALDTLVQEAPAASDHPPPG